MKKMEYVADNDNQVDSWQEVTLVYNAALKQIMCIVIIQSSTLNPA